MGGAYTKKYFFLMGGLVVHFHTYIILTKLINIKTYFLKFWRGFELLEPPFIRACLAGKIQVGSIATSTI